MATPTPRQGEKSNAMLGADFMDYGGLIRIACLSFAEQPVPELRILLLQKSSEASLQRGRCQFIAILQPPAKQLVEFPSAATATPAQTLEFGIHRQIIFFDAYQVRRSTMSFLISAIALAGFRPFGQVRVQFMIVWQRYKRNGSSSSSRRSPVSSSRLSTIQR